MRTDPQNRGLENLAGLVLTIVVSGSLSGILVYGCWNWGLAPLLAADPMPGVWRSMVRSSEAIAFVVVWRATR